MVAPWFYSYLNRISLCPVQVKSYLLLHCSVMSHWLPRPAQTKLQLWLVCCHVSQCIQEYLDPAYASSNFSPCKKIKTVVMTIPGTTYLSKNIRDLHQCPDATLDNCSGTTAAFPQGDLNPKQVLFYHLCDCCFFLHTQQYHVQAILPHSPLFLALLSSANLLVSESSHASCPSCLQKPWHIVSYPSSAYCSWAPCLGV